jgi:hypothetical protein
MNELINLLPRKQRRRIDFLCHNAHYINYTMIRYDPIKPDYSKILIDLKKSDYLTPNLKLVVELLTIFKNINLSNEQITEYWANKQIN